MLCKFWLGDIALFRNTLVASLWSHTYHLYQFRMVVFLGISAYCTQEWNAAFAILESIYSFDSNCKKKASWMVNLFFWRRQNVWFHEKLTYCLKGFHKWRWAWRLSISSSKATTKAKPKGDFSTRNHCRNKKWTTRHMPKIRRVDYALKRYRSSLKSIGMWS